MLQKEFEDRIGRSVTEQEYVEANAMYENAGDMDKEEFCREWLKIGSARLVQCLAEECHRRNRIIQELAKEKEELELLHKGAVEIHSDAADAMLEIEQGLLDGENVEHTAREVFAAELLDRKAWWLVGAKEVVLRKIRMGMALTEKDKNYINEHLK